MNSYDSMTFIDKETEYEKKIKLGKLGLSSTYSLGFKRMCRH